MSFTLFAGALSAVRRSAFPLSLTFSLIFGLQLHAAPPAVTPGARPQPSAQVSPVIVILATNGLVEVLRAGAQTWDFASPWPEKNRLHPGDQLRTGSNSHARVQLADRTIVPIGP